jgi:transposase-like protein
MVSRHSQYVNNLVEQDHRGVKRMVRPMLGFKAFWRARGTIAGIAVMHATRKGQLKVRETLQTPAEQFYS